MEVSGVQWARLIMEKVDQIESARQALNQQEFKVAFLDHDLHWMHADNTIFKGTGKEIAKHLAEHRFQGIVVIHSRHVEGAAAMKKFLPKAKLAPFGTMPERCWIL